MAKYHISRKGELAPCDADVKSCPLGNVEHFEADTPQQAQKMFEDSMNAQHGETATLRAQNEKEATPRVERKIDLRLQSYYNLEDRMREIEDRRKLVLNALKTLKNPANSDQSTVRYGMDSLPFDIKKYVDETVDYLGDDASPAAIRDARIQELKGWERQLSEEGNRVEDSLDRAWGRVKDRKTEDHGADRTPKATISKKVIDAFHEDESIFKDMKSVTKDEIFETTDLSKADFDKAWGKLVESSQAGNIPPTYRGSAVQEFHLAYYDGGARKI